MLGPGRDRRGDAEVARGRQRQAPMHRSMPAWRTSHPGGAASSTTPRTSSSSIATTTRTSGRRVWRRRPASCPRRWSWRPWTIVTTASRALTRRPRGRDEVRGRGERVEPHRRVLRAAARAPPLPRRAAPPHGVVEQAGPALGGRPADVPRRHPEPLHRPHRRLLLPERALLRDDDGRRAGGGDVGHRVLPGVRDDDVGGAQLVPQVGGGVGRAALGPLPAGGGGPGGRDRAGVGVAAARTPHDEHPPPAVGARGGDPWAAVEPRQATHGVQLVDPGSRPDGIVRPPRPRREQPLGEVVGGEVGTVGPLAGQRDDDDRHPAEPHGQGRLDRHVRDDEPGPGPGDPRRERSRPVADSAVVQRSPVQDAAGVEVVAGRRVVVGREPHPAVLEPGRRRQGAQADHGRAQVGRDGRHPGQVPAAVVVDVVADHAAPLSGSIAS